LEATIVEVIRLSNSFPSFVNNEDNLELMKEVGKDEFLKIYRDSKGIKS
jgi:hypothetical protein